MWTKNSHKSLAREQRDPNRHKTARTYLCRSYCEKKKEILGEIVARFHRLKVLSVMQPRDETLKENYITLHHIKAFYTTSCNKI